MIQARTQWNGAQAFATFRAVSWTAIKYIVTFCKTQVQDVLNVSADPQYVVRKRNTKAGPKGSSRTIYINPSKPGEAPHKRTGNLQRNVLTDLDEAKQIGKLGVTPMAIYGGYLETAKNRNVWRPWLLSTIKALMPQIQAMGNEIAHVSGGESPHG